MANSRADSIVGCIVGGAIGDAAGAAFEGRPAIATVELDSVDWHLTDDTHLTLATCEALIEHPVPQPEFIAAAFLRWFRARQITGLGASTLQALRDLEAGGHWALAGRKGDRAAGNGAAMRIAPLAFARDPFADESRTVVRDVCRITHHSDEAYAGAYAVVMAIATVPDARHWTGSPRACRIRPCGRDQVANLGFEGMLRQVIAAGRDTDTNASLAGQIAGASLGFAGLPPPLLKRLPDQELVLGIARDFAESVVRRLIKPK